MIIANDTISVGIHLGATYSCIGIWFNNKAEIIANSHGSRTTPSYIAFTDTEIFIGEAAYCQLAINPMNTVFDITRLIGRKFNEEIVQKHIKSLPYKIEEDPAGKPLIIVTYKGETKQFFPEELLAMLLSKLKEDAESFLDKPIKDIVISTPAICSDAQRVGIKDAAKLAGLNLVRLIREPVAAAIAYKLDENLGVLKNIFVFDLGGSSFELSVITVEEGVFEVIAVGGERLGGCDFDNKLVEFCVEDFKNKTGFDIRNNQKAIKRLKICCERAKRALSFSTQAIIEADALYESVDYNCTITRAKFEELCSSLFDQIIPLAEQVLKDAQLTKEQIHDIILIGGSSNIPSIVELISKYYTGKELLNSINPDEALAYGITIQSAIIAGGYGPMPDLFISDYLVLSLGIETAGGLMTDILPRNTTIPAKKKRLCTTYTDNQSSVLIKIYEGQRILAKDNHFIDKVELEGLPLGPRGATQIEVNFEIESNHDVNVEVVEKTSGQSKKILIPNEMIEHSVESIIKMVEEAELNKKEDEIQKERIEARNNLEGYCYEVKIALKDGRLQEVSGFEAEKIEAMCDNIIKWIKNNMNAEIEEIIKKKREIEEIFSENDKEIQPIEYEVCIQNEVEGLNKNAGPIVKEME